MLNKYGERMQPCQTPFLTGNHSDSVPATLTLASCFLYSLASKAIKCRGYPMSIVVTQSLSWEIVERLLEVHEAHIECGCWCSRSLCISILRFVIWSLVPYLVGILPARLQFLFRSSLGSFPVWSEEGSCLLGKPEQLFCSFTLFKVTFLGKWDECGEHSFISFSFPVCHTYSVHSDTVQCCFSFCFEQFRWDIIDLWLCDLQSDGSHEQPLNQVVGALSHNILVQFHSPPHRGTSLRNTLSTCCSCGRSNNC